MQKYWFVSVCVVISSLLATGCWNYRDLDGEALVGCLGYDLDSQKPVITAEVILPPNGKTQESGRDVTTPKKGELVQGRGRSVYEAIDNLSEGVSKPLQLALNNAYVFSESFARSNFFSSGLDRITRMDLARRTGVMYVSAGQASDILSAKVVLADNIGTELKGISEQTKAEQLSIREDLNDFLFDVSTPGIEPMVSRVETQSNEVERNALVKVEGSGVFRGHQLVGWLDGPETRGVLWLRGKTGHPTLLFQWKGNQVQVRTRDINARIVPIRIQKEPVFLVRIHWHGRLIMYTGHKPVEQDDLPSLQQEVGKIIEKTVNHSIARAQELQTDVIGFGNALYRKEPNYFWTQYHDWNTDGFPQAKIQIQVDASIIGGGLASHSPGEGVNHNRQIRVQ